MDSYTPFSKFDEWRQEQSRLRKAPSRDGRQSPINPGVGMMGHMNTSSYAPTGPTDRPSGYRGLGLKSDPRNPATQQFGVPSGVGPQQSQGPSKYDLERPDQPPPWITDVNLESVWYSPFEPVWPFGPPYYARPRDWDYPVGYNLNFVPERMAQFGLLRAMRRSWGLIATAVSTREDQLLRIPWTIQVKGHPRKSSKGIEEIKKFMRKPDGKNSFNQWSRMLLDDSLVIDAPAVYFNRGRGGKILTAEVLDGSTVFPLIDDAGRRPDSGYTINQNGNIDYSFRQPAFQQIIYGLPMVNLSEDELLYPIFRPLPERPIFGFSPVEQIFVEATEGIRKTFYQMEFWRDGSLPNLIITVPDNWTPHQIAMFQAHFDSMFSGQLDLKAKVRFVPGGMKPFDIKNSSGESLWSQRDEFLTRLVCFAFSISPMYFAKFFNRACYSADTETLTESGWKRFDEINKGEKIASVNPETGCLEYHIPDEFHLYEIENENLVRFQTQNVDVLVTREHEMWLRPSNNAKYYKKEQAQNLSNHAQFYFMAAVGYDGGEEQHEFVLPTVDKYVNVEAPARAFDMNLWLKLLGYYISEGGMAGNRYFFTLAQKLGRLEEANIEQTLATLDISYSTYTDEKKGHRRWNVSGKQICKWLAENAGDVSENKRIPREFFKLPRRQLFILFKALMDGDGTWNARVGRNSGAYFTTSPQLADDVQELAFILGLSTATTVHYEANGNRQKAYRVLISTRHEYNLMGKETSTTPCSVHEEAYTGAVYCFKVQNHLFVTRRNGKIAIHGNTANNAAQLAVEEGLYPMMGWWKDDVWDEIIQNRMGYDDIEIAFLPRPDPDNLKNAQIVDLKIKRGEMSIDESRAADGREPLPNGDGSGYLVYVGNGAFPVGQLANGTAGIPGAPAAQNKPKGQPSGRSPIVAPSRAHEASAQPPVNKSLRGDIDDAAKEAAKPTKAQRKAGNYKKGHVRFQGLEISIETPRGRKRKGHDPNGTKWASRMADNYGYIRGTVGADGDQVDTMIGRHPKSPLVFVIDQIDPDTHQFDEHKIMLGYRTPASAAKAYFDSNADGRGSQRLSAMTLLTVSALRAWLVHGNQSYPIAQQSVGHVIDPRDLRKSDTISQSTGLLWYDQQPAAPTKKRKKKWRRQQPLETPYLSELQA